MSFISLWYVWAWRFDVKRVFFPKKEDLFSWGLFELLVVIEGPSSLVFFCSSLSCSNTLKLKIRKYRTSLRLGCSDRFPDERPSESRKGSQSEKCPRCYSARQKCDWSCSAQDGRDSPRRSACYWSNEYWYSSKMEIEFVLLRKVDSMSCFWTWEAIVGRGLSIIYYYYLYIYFIIVFYMNIIK